MDEWKLAQRSSVPSDHVRQTGIDPSRSLLLKPVIVQRGFHFPNLPRVLILDFNFLRMKFRNFFLPFFVIPLSHKLQEIYMLLEPSNLLLCFLLFLFLATIPTITWIVACTSERPPARTSKRRSATFHPFSSGRASSKVHCRSFPAQNWSRRKTDRKLRTWDRGICERADWILSLIGSS